MSASHTALYPVGPHAAQIDHLWWFLFWLCLVVWVVVTAFLLAALLRPRMTSVSERRITQVVAAGTILTTLCLFAILIVSVSTGSLLSARPSEDVVSINVTGHQWWWEVRYEATPAHAAVITANEIHVPVGQSVILKTTSNDVIHSFWAPNLAGKIDSIPNHVNTIWFRADRPGTYRGQCAEFCGFQHAHMAFFVIAEPRVRFEAWLEQQRQEAHAPANDVESKGQAVFLESPCVLCHTIAGTTAAGTVAPDLTHVGSRQTIAAGTLSNSGDHLAHWIQNSQTFKPGNRMPPINLRAEDVKPLVAYLESLK